jgi:hypothetical protein
LRVADTQADQKDIRSVITQLAHQENAMRPLVCGWRAPKYSLQSFLSGAQPFFNLADLSGGVSKMKLIMAKINYLAR